jgi:hypothetical protein
VRATYADGSQAHVLVRGGFRGWFKPTGAIPADAKDPTSDDSCRVFGVNVLVGYSVRRFASATRARRDWWRRSSGMSATATSMRRR